MLAGVKIKINPRTFENDLISFKNKNDIMTLLVHLGYLAFDFDTKEAYIPNHEIRSVFEDVVTEAHWDGVATALAQSQKLMEEIRR